MLAVYLAALILGLGAFLVQLFGSEGTEHGGPALDAEAEVGELVAGEPPGSAEPAASGHVGFASVFLSLRFYMFAALGFGGVGAPVTALGAGSPLATLLAALATALGLGSLASFGFRSLAAQTLSSGATEADLRGQVGRVLVTCEKGRRGKVRLIVRGQTLDLIATTDEAALPPGAGVIVEDVRAGEVHVCAAPRELLPG